MKAFLRWLLRLLYGFRGYNVEALKAPGPVLLLPNHVSWWDWVLIGVWLDDDWRFVTSSQTARTSWLHRRLMINRRTFPVDMNSPYAVKHIAEYLHGGGRLVLFPEGRLSLTGSMMKLFEGTGFLLSKTHAKVITAYLRNAHRLPFSPNPAAKQWFPRLSVHFSPPLALPELLHVRHAEARARFVEGLREQMLKQRFEVEMAFGPGTLPDAIQHAASIHQGKAVLQDVTMRPLDYPRLLIGAELLAKQWRRLAGAAAPPRIGVLLPNVNAVPATLLSLWKAGRIPAILNYSLGATDMATCARLAGLRQVITSRAFVAQAKLELGPFRDAGIELVYLEDVRARISGLQKLLAAARVHARDYVPGLGAPAAKCGPEDTAVVLFTSGSEGEPKAVELTHRNLLANMRQMLAMVDLLETDRFFNSLPVFHSFGLTVGLLLPLVQGNFVFLYVSPLHYRLVPAAFYNLDCTIFFGTNTFLTGYGRKGHPFDFRALRYVFCGGEKLQDATAALWMRKFGVRVLEGYGTTECSPCVTINTPMRPRYGSAGQFLPGIEYRLEPVQGIDGAHGTEPAAPGVHAPHESEADGETDHAVAPAADGGASPAQFPSGRLFVRGPNIMRGYVNADANAYFQALDGWYDTGDIARVDSEGYVYILGRLKRFAKVSGEMVSLTAVEETLAESFPQYGAKFAIAVIARADDVKGEKLLAVTNEPRLKIEEVRQALRARGFGNLAVPRELKCVHEVPRLATGKINHRLLEKMV
jgi:acyl-[acyl-carrier-protein]-phospholipid O-acyltransferase/long-chain-fatty-acid--[acyl-carrier-protein] ligase